MKNSEIHSIISKLDAFIKKYYFNEFLKGLILFSLVFIFYFISISSIEYFAFFPIITRTIVFYVSLVLFVLLFIFYVLIPLGKVYKIGKTLSYKAASSIISRHFPEVKDTLLNALELSNDNQLIDNSLAIAAINQKIKLLKPIPFSTAIDYSKLFTYWKYAASIVVIIIIISVFYPGAILNGAQRIVHPQKYFAKPAPFSFILDNKILNVIKGADYTVSLRVEGKFVPSQVQIVIGGNFFFMQKKSNTLFEYTIQSCNNSIQFHFFADEYNSQDYSLQVTSLPQLLNFTIQAEVPSYTGLDNFTVTNTGDISVPIGTKLLWNVTAVDAQSLSLLMLSDSSKKMFEKQIDNFMLRQTILKTSPYKILGSNSYFNQSTIIDYTFTVIPDLSPSIDAIFKQDSISYFVYYFKGQIQDDYGFSSLNFVYFDSENPKRITKIPVQFSRNTPRQDFYYMFDFSQFQSGQKIKYYFEVSDNDGINGNKFARTTVSEFKIPTLNEVDALQDQMSDKIENQSQQSLSLTQELVKDINTLQKKMLNENMSDWERKQIMQDIQEKQQKIKDNVKELTQMFQQKSELQKQLSPEDQKLIDKQKQIEDLLQNLMDDELQNLFKEFNKMMDEFKKEDFMKKSDEMKQSFEELSKQMDRDIELLKRMDVEEKIKSSANQLEELANKQEKLSQDLQNSKKSNEEIQKQQNDLQKQTNDLQEKYNDAIEKNQELQDKMEMQNFDKEFQNIENSQQNSSQQMQQNQKSKSSKSMKQSSDAMKKLSETMQQMLAQQQQKQSMEDMDNLRQILDNLLTFSFQQEKLIPATNTLAYADPKYASVNFKQNALRDNFSNIRDSLYNLSTRVEQISVPINKELFSISQNMDLIITALEQHQRSSAVINQQYVMTSTNNLILLLSEVLDAMQQAAAQQMQGQQQCQNPSSGSGKKPSMSQIKGMQQSLKQQMEQMMQQLKNGGMPAQSMQQQMSKMLMQQQMMEQMTQQMMKNGQLSPEGVKQLKEIQRLMEQTEQDIVNQNITPQTIMRQEQILTRLLESEKAKNERDIDKKRESNEAKDNYSKPKAIFNDEKSSKVYYEDVYEKTNLKFKSYYLKIFNDYLMIINDN